jgi:hypothetical protein
VRDISGNVLDGVFNFSGYAEREYDLHVRYQVGDFSEPKDKHKIAFSDSVKLVPGKEPATVHLVLTKTILATDKLH